MKRNILCVFLAAFVFFALGSISIASVPATNPLAEQEGCGCVKETTATINLAYPILKITLKDVKGEIEIELADDKNMEDLAKLSGQTFPARISFGEIKGAECAEISITTPAGDLIFITCDLGKHKKVMKYNI